MVFMGSRNRTPQPARSRLTGDPAVRHSLLIRQRGRCVYCNMAISDSKGNYHVDHKTPLARGGADTITNVRALCGRCIADKAARTDAEYLSYLRSGRRMESPEYVEFRRRSRRLPPRRSFGLYALYVIVGASAAGYLAGEFWLERGASAAAALAVLSIVWAVAAFARGLSTGALAR